MKCPKCGKEVGDAKFCPYCGAKLEEKPQQSAEKVENKSEIQNSENSQVPKKHKKINAPAIIAMSVAVIFLIVIVNIANMKAPTSRGAQSSLSGASDEEFPSTYHFDSSPDYGSNVSNSDSSSSYDDSEESSSEAVSSQTPAEAAANKASFIKACKTINYKDAARSPKQYLGNQVKFKGKVQQVVDDDDSQTTLMIYVDPDEYGNYEDPIYVSYEKSDKSEPRILENDIVTAYGVMSDLQTYTTVMGASKTIPSMLASYVVVSK